MSHDIAIGDRVTVVRKGIWRYGQTGTVTSVTAFTALVDFGDGADAFLGGWLARAALAEADHA